MSGWSKRATRRIEAETDLKNPQWKKDGPQFAVTFEATVDPRLSPDVTVFGDAPYFYVDLQRLLNARSGVPRKVTVEIRTSS